MARRQSIRRLRRTRRLFLCAIILAITSLLCLVWPQPAARISSQTENEQDDKQPSEVALDGNIMEPTLLDISQGTLTVADDTLMAPYGTQVLRISDEGIQIYWKKVEGAVGYEVSRTYAEDADPEHLAYVTKASFTFTDDTFDHDRGTVFYVVRALSGDKDAYATGPWSQPIEAAFLKRMQLSREKWYLPHGDSYQFEASFGWGSVHDAAWSSSDGRVATIDGTGLLTARAAGTVTITCTSDELGQVATATVEVDRSEQSMLADPSPRYTQDDEGIWRNPHAGQARNAVIMMAGDLMCMSPQMKSHYSEGEGYNFNACYRYVRDVLAKSDLAVGNLETMLASAYPYNGEAGYINGKPVCNAPARYLDALRYGGFDLLCMANNHNADVGPRAVGMTLAQVERYEFAHTGLFASPDEDRTLLVDVNGIKVGFVAYVDATCGFNGQDRSWSEEDRDTLLNYYSPERATADMAHLRERGAEYIIGYLHWGVKNHYDPVERQEQTAQELADSGIDYLVGSHPHLVQRYEEIRAADGRTVPCIYSLGDFNSYINQVEGNLDSILLRIRLHRTKDGQVVLAENAYIPCHIYRTYDAERYVTMPLSAKLTGGANMPDAKAIRARIAGQVGESLPRYVP